MKFSEMPYRRVEKEETEKIFGELLQKAASAKSGEELFAVHQDYYRLYGDVLTNLTLASIRHGIDTTDEFYDRENDYYDSLLPVLQGYMTAYSKVLYDSPFRPYLEEKIGKVAFKNIELQMKSFDEKIIPLMQEENALVSRYKKILANCKIDFNGEILNLTGLKVYMTDSDREMRKKAYRAYSDYLAGVTGELDEIYDALVKNRTAQARALGYKDYVELGYYRMRRNDYGREQVENFRRQIKEYFVPFVSAIHEGRKKDLGVDSLKVYDNDIYFLNGNPKPTGTPEEILKAGQTMYRELSPETREFFDFMMENELFDVYGRPTKEQGGYMTYLPNYKSPFIFANFNGTSADVDVITHECGHAFQGFVSRNDEILEHLDITMETAEIHSMSMEFFTCGWMNSFFGDRGDDYIKMHYDAFNVFIPYGTMVDEFQHIVYENPDMTPAERKETWKKLEKIYRPHIDFEGDGLEEYIWQRQHHIFTSPFYYIDYVLASVCALQYKVWMDKDYKEAWQSYLKLCGLSAAKFYSEELAEVGLDNPFADGTIEKLVKALEK